MSQRLFILCACLCLLCGAGGLWVGASAVFAATPEQQQAALPPDETPDPIANGSEDVERFFHTYGFNARFKFLAGWRDESLGRRYYRVRIGVDRVGQLRERLVQGWTWGHFNRAVYEDNLSSRVPRSHNLPKWWRQPRTGGNSDETTTLMLDHAGKPNWYVVLCADGEVDMLWVSR